MSSILLTRILFALVFISTWVYWLISFKDHKNIIYKLPKWHRRPYMLGLLWVAVASLNISLRKDPSIFDLNMFLIGAFIVMATVAIWDKKATTYYNPPDEKD